MELSEPVDGDTGERSQPMTKQYSEDEVKKLVWEAAKHGAAKGYAVGKTEGVRRFDFGDDGQELKRPGRAPAHVHSLGEQPYSLFKAFSSIWAGDASKAPLEWAISQKLASLGYAPAMRGGILIPLGADLLWKTEGREQETERLMSEVKSMFSYGPTVDREELARATKALDPFDDTLGGTLMPFPVQGELVALLRTLAVVSA